MKCIECTWKNIPFFSCKQDSLNDKHSQILGCNIDGELPSLSDMEESNEG